MKIAIPVSQGKLSPHFGHCDYFSIYTINTHNKTIQEKYDVPSPAHAPGLLPAWLAELGVTTVITGGIGLRAQALFSDKGIQIICGVAEEEPDQITSAYLQGGLPSGNNLCDH